MSIPSSNAITVPVLRRGKPSTLQLTENPAPLLSLSTPQPRRHRCHIVTVPPVPRTSELPRPSTNGAVIPGLRIALIIAYHNLGLFAVSQDHGWTF
jgi:hypothetical protein